MKVKITYPEIKKGGFRREVLLNILKWPFLLAAYICPIVNFFTGGKAWSVIVLMGLFMLWSLIFSTDLVEYNRISQSIKAITYSCIMLILIDVFLVSGWAMLVVPIVCFGGLIVTGTLFFTDLKRQKQNLFPMFLLIIVSIIASAVGLCVWPGESRWALAVMGALAVALLFACGSVLRGEFLRELKKRFHIN